MRGVRNPWTPSCESCHRVAVGRDAADRRACVHHCVPHHPRVLDLRGWESGALTARERVGTNARGAALWACDCACGGTRVVPAPQLAAGRYVHCGLARHPRQPATRAA
jgi:hypothetical protein